MIYFKTVAVYCERGEGGIENKRYEGMYRLFIMADF